MRRRAFLAVAALGGFPAARGANPYPPVLPGRALHFPRDHGAHPDFRTEWWYLTGQVEARGGRRFGFQVTFFRSRPGVADDSPSRFAARQLVLAHAAVSDAAAAVLLHDERAARAVFDLAGTALETTRAWIGDWTLARRKDAYFTRVMARDFSLELTCAMTQPVLVHGENGYSRKGPLARQASYYYSVPQLAVSGRLGLGGTSLEVAGTAWLDHEWSTEILAPGAVGWDWLGINLDDGGAVMAFVVRNRDGGPVWAAATLRDAALRRSAVPSAGVQLASRRLWRSPRTGARYPVAVHVRLAERSFELEPWFDDQELDARASTGTIYWEGAVSAREGGRLCGGGYLELTGYAAPLTL